MVPRLRVSCAYCEWGEKKKALTGRLARDIVSHTSDTVDLIDNARRDPLQKAKVEFEGLV